MEEQINQQEFQLDNSRFSCTSNTINDFCCEAYNWQEKYHIKVQFIGQTHSRLHVYIADTQLGTTFEGHFKFYQLPIKIGEHFKTIILFSKDFKKIIQTKNYHRLKILQSGDIVYTFQINDHGKMIQVEETLKTQQKISQDFHILLKKILILQKKQKSTDQQNKKIHQKIQLLNQQIKDLQKSKTQETIFSEKRISFLQEMQNNVLNKATDKQNQINQSNNIVLKIQKMLNKVQFMQVLQNTDMKIENFKKQTKKSIQVFQENLFNQQKNMKSNQKILQDKIQCQKQEMDQIRQKINVISQQLNQQKGSFQKFIQNSKKIVENQLSHKQQLKKNSLQVKNTQIQLKKNLYQQKSQEQAKYLKQNNEREIKYIMSKLMSFDQQKQKITSLLNNFYKLDNYYKNQINQIKKQEDVFRRKLIVSEYFRIAPFISNILQNQNECRNLFKMFGTKKRVQMKLLFKASQHGFLASEFHRICDGIPNTLVLIKTEYGKKIGGFTTCKWNSNTLEYSKDKSESFLFSLTNGTIFTHSKNQLEQIYNSPTTGPVFRSQQNIDLQISDLCHINDSFANPGHTYTNKECTKDQNQTLKAFIGSQRLNQEQQNSQENCFKTLEYEVYKVDFQKVGKENYQQTISYQESQKKLLRRFNNGPSVYLNQNNYRLGLTLTQKDGQLRS